MDDEITVYSERLGLGGAMRVARRIAMSGIASRRKAEDLIREGRVSFAEGGGKVELSTVLQAHESIKVDNRLQSPIPRVNLWRYHKPRGRLTTRVDPRHRRTIFDDLPKALKGLVAVGRLDFDSEGILLLTNNGQLSRLLEHPEQAIARGYHVRVHGNLPKRAETELKQGIEVEGMVYKGIELTRGTGAEKGWVKMVLREGKNREIRRVMKHYGCEVSQLVRVFYGQVQLGDMKQGEVAEVGETTLKRVLHDLVERVAKKEGGRI